MTTSGERGVAVKQDGGAMSAPTNIVLLRFVTLGFCAVARRSPNKDRAR